MPKYLVTLSATEQIPVETHSKEEAARLAFKQLDPDIDWDVDFIDDISNNRIQLLNWFSEKYNEDEIERMKKEEGIS